MDDCKSGNQLVVTDKVSKKKYGPYCGTKKPPKLTLGNEVEITMKKRSTPHPTAGRGVIFMVGYQAFDKGTAPPSKGKGKPVLAYNPDARSNVGNGPAAATAPMAKPSGKSSGSSSSKGVNGVNVRTGASGLVAVGMYKVDPKTGRVTYQKPPPQIQMKSAAGNAGGDIKTGPQGKNGSPGGMVNGKCMDPPGMGCNNENWGKGAQDVTTSQPIDKENMPAAMKGYNLTEFASWVNGDIREVTKKQATTTVAPILTTTQAPLTLDPVLLDQLNRNNLWQSNRRVPTGLGVVMPEQFYTTQQEPEIDPEEEEKREIQRILFICGGVLGLCVLVLIVLRVLIFIKGVQQAALKRQAEQHEMIRQQLQRKPVSFQL